MPSLIHFAVYCLSFRGGNRKFLGFRRRQLAHSLFVNVSAPDTVAIGIPGGASTAAAWVPVTKSRIQLSDPRLLSLVDVLQVIVVPTRIKFVLISRTVS